MEKRYVVLILLLIATMVFVQTGFVSSDILNSTVTPISANSSQLTIYNFTVTDNSTTGINFTQIVIFPNPFDYYPIPITSTNGTDSLSNFSQSGYIFVWKNDSGVIDSGGHHHFWFSAVNPNVTGNFRFIVGVNDTSGNSNETVINVTLHDVTLPKISFASPTPANSSTKDQTYILANFTARDNVAVKNVTILLTKPSGSVTKTVNSSPYSYNFTNLSNGLYKINATVYDTSGNHNSTGIRYVTLNFTNSSQIVSCTENWTCGNWAPVNCTNGTQTRICTDQNSCGTTVNKPNTTQTCTVVNVTCQPVWDCGNWIPVNCSKGQNQTKTCTDTSNCSKPDEVTQRPCPTTSTSTTPATSVSTKTKSSSISTLFLGIIGFIVLSVVIVVVVLMRMKHKSDTSGGTDTGSNVTGMPPNSTSPGYPSYGNPPPY